MKQKIQIKCKKEFYYPSTTRLIFEENYYYYYYLDEYDADYIFIYYDEENTNIARQGYRFYIGNGNYYLNEYFYTIKEVRKLKLKKLNETKMYK